MPIEVTNTLSGKKELFEPVVPGEVVMYVCGPTVYDYCHIGHARVYVTFDVVYRTLKALGFKTTYIRNLTDIDDKIIKRANDEGMSAKEIAETYIQTFQEDMASLRNLPPDHEPRATEHVDGMITLIERLIEKGYAYEAASDVYFAVDKFDSYCELSKKDLESLQAGARVEAGEQKRNPLDFALWKAAKPGEPKWPSPWGEGRPGWHIECSVMSHQYAGRTLDIHAGGRDLIFPHHENEIAQSEAGYDQPFVKYWLHNGFVNLDKEKMSKSIGNLVTIRDLLTRYHPEVVRHFILSCHYRSPIEYHDDALIQSQQALERGYTFLANFGQLDKRAKPLEAFQVALEDDFNAAKAIGVLFEAIKEGNRLLDAGDQQAATALASRLVTSGEFLGLWVDTPDAFLKFKAGGEDQAPANWIEEQIEKRKQARDGKDFKEADRIRDELKNKGVLIEDRADGTHWKYSS